MSIEPIAAILSAAIGYFVGSLAFGYWVAKSNGVDIFAVGSRSPGATNVKRSVGKKAGNLVFLLDFVKGLVATGWPLVAYSNLEYTESYGLLGLLAAVIGHSFSMFTPFRGGKGVAAMLGGVVALMPVAALIGIVIWLAIFYSTRYVSVASILMAVSLPISNRLLDAEATLQWMSLALAVIVTVRHKANIGRLIRGEENRFEKRSSESENSE